MGSVPRVSGIDKFRIKIGDEDTQSAIVYGNQPAEETSGATTILGWGPIVILAKISVLFLPSSHSEGIICNR